MSKSMTATFLPRFARPHARLADVVVLPTPPFPDVTTMISVSLCAAAGAADGGGDSFRIADISDDLLALCGTDASEVKILACKPCLHGLARELGGNRFEHTKNAGYGDELRIELLAEDPCRLLAACARERAPAERPVDVHAAVGHDLRTRADGVRDDQIAAARINALPRAHRLVVEQRDRRLRRRGRGRSRRRRRLLRLRRLRRSGGFRRLRPEIPQQRAERRLRRRPPLRDQRQVERARERVDGIVALHETDRVEPSVANRRQYRAELARGRHVRQLAEIDADGGALLEELRRARDACAELVT